jgi:hypothetical protein
MTEFAIVLPVVLMLLLAIAEFGRAFWEYNTLTQTVRDAGRYASSQGLFGSTGVVIVTEQLRTDVANLVVYGNVTGSGAPLLDGLSPDNVTVESPGEDDILVRATYAYTPIFDFIPNFRGGGVSPFLNFEATVRMRSI